MSSAYVIVCKACGSYWTAQVASPGTGVRCYHCSRCGAVFDVEDVAAYVAQHPPNLQRCSECDEEGVKLVERNHRYHSGQPRDEVTDLYQCSRCGQKILVIVKKSGHVLYD